MICVHWFAFVCLLWRHVTCPYHTRSFRFRQVANRKESAREASPDSDQTSCESDYVDASPDEAVPLIRLNTSGDAVRASDPPRVAVLPCEEERGRLVVSRVEKLLSHSSLHLPLSLRFFSVCSAFSKTNFHTASCAVSFQIVFLNTYSDFASPVTE